MAREFVPNTRKNTGHSAPQQRGMSNLGIGGRPKHTEEDKLPGVSAVGKPTRTVTGNNWGAQSSAAHRRQWLLVNPDFDEKPATMEEFLGPRYLNIDPAQNPNLPQNVGIRTGVKQALVDIFGDSIDPTSISKIKRGMFTGGIGVGKSTLASIALTYMVHWVECLHDPQTYFGLLPGSRIAFMLMSTRAQHAQEVMFGDIKARVESCKWFQDNCRHDERLKKQLRFPNDIWIIPGTSEETSVEGYNVLCTDEKTLALTKRGWLSYKNIDPETDELYTLNHETGLAEWKPIQRMNIFPVENVPVKSMIGSEFSSVTSMGHKWAVEYRSTGKTVRKRWKTSATLNSEDMIPISAISNDRPQEQKYTDALVEAVAWFYTEGSIVGNTAANIYQKTGTIGETRIAKCLTEIFGQDSVEMRKDYRVNGPMWRINRRADRNLTEFRLNKAAGSVLLDYAPEKVPSHEFLLNLTQSQLELFISVSMLADNRGKDSFAQKNYASAEAFAFACTLAGKAVSIREQWQPTGDDGYEMLIVRMLKKHCVKPIHAANQPTAKIVVENKKHTGVLWCPTVENSTWLARREGSVYFTGNCGIIDEGDSHKVTQDKDYAYEAWSTIHGRISSRFTDPKTKDHRGLLLAIGQMKKSTGFMAKKKKELLTDGKPNQLVVEMSIWDSLGWHRFLKDDGSRDSFWFNTVRRKVASPAEVIGGGKNVIEIPMAYRKDFDNDPSRALKDHAGIPPAVDDPFITMIDRVDEAQDKWRTRYEPLWSYAVDSSCTNPQFHPDFKATNILKRAVHVDIAYAPGGDALGMAMGHIPELVEIDGELKPIIVIDFLLRIKPSGGDALELATFRRILYDLRDEMKFKIGVVTFDGFQSQDSIQILRKKHFNVGEMSVDRNKAPYEELREAIYERRIELPKYMTYINRGDAEKVNISRVELSELQDTGRKIDHPEKGSKDVADAIAGVVFDLMSNISFRRGSSRPVSKAEAINEQEIADEMRYGSIVRGETIDISGELPVDALDGLVELGGNRYPTAERSGMGLPALERDPFGLGAGAS